MSLLLKKFVLAAALLVMPLQGMAATFSMLFCEGDAHKHAMHANSSHDRGTQQDSNQIEGGTNGDSTYHSCHNTVSAPMFVTSLAAALNFPVQAMAPDPSHDLFVPDRPQRPPLA